MNKNSNSEESLCDNSSVSQKLKFPYEMKQFDLETNKKMIELFSGQKTGYIHVGPKKYVLPNKYTNCAEEIYNFNVRSDDIWIVTFFRSGTTLTQEMVWLLENNHDYDTAKKSLLSDRFPYFECTTFMHPDIMDQLHKFNNFSKQNQKVIAQMCIPNWKILENHCGRRLIKTHLPFSLLPPNLLTSGCKVVYVARNPKDVMVSSYHLSKLFVFQGYTGDLEQFANLFMEDKISLTPYWSHLEEAWELRHSKNFLFMFYEDMNKDLRHTIKKVSKFLEKDVTEKELEKLENHLQLESFRNNPMINEKYLVDLGVINKGVEGFIRNGKISSLKDDTNEEYIKKFNKWAEINFKRMNINYYLN